MVGGRPKALSFIETKDNKTDFEDQSKSVATFSNDPHYIRS